MVDLHHSPVDSSCVSEYRKGLAAAYLVRARVGVVVGAEVSVLCLRADLLVQDPVAVVRLRADLVVQEPVVRLRVHLPALLQQSVRLPGHLKTNDNSFFNLKKK